MPDAFRLDGAEAFGKTLAGFLEAARRDVGNHVKDLAYRIAYNLVMETPQYSGAAASAWRVGLGSPEYVTEKPRYEVPSAGPGVGDSPYDRNSNRNMRAVNDALMACGFEIGMYTLQAGDVYIANGLPYTQWFPKGEHAPGKMLRSVNLPQRTVPQIVAASLNPSSVLRF